jgi:hypothetical protein
MERLGYRVRVRVRVRLDLGLELELGLGLEFRHWVRVSGGYTKEMSDGYKQAEVRV